MTPGKPERTRPGGSATVLRVRKLDVGGRELISYAATHVARGRDHVVVEAFFDHEDFPLLDTVIKRGDRFVETYYSDRGYNTFAIFDRDDGAFKGWYCNLSRPAVIGPDEVIWVDLALDLWVWPDGRRAVLDRDEFEALPLTPDERGRVLASLGDLERAFDEGVHPP